MDVRLQAARVAGGRRQSSMEGLATYIRTDSSLCTGVVGAANRIMDTKNMPSVFGREQLTILVCRTIDKSKKNLPGSELF